MTTKEILTYSGIFVFIITAMIIVSRMSSRGEDTDRYDYCWLDRDCKCGLREETGECVVGNKSSVKASSQCYDYCFSGVGFEIKCVETHCQRVFVGN